MKRRGEYRFARARTRSSEEHTDHVFTSVEGEKRRAAGCADFGAKTTRGLRRSDHDGSLDRLHVVPSRIAVHFTEERGTTLPTHQKYARAAPPRIIEIKRGRQQNG